LNKGNVELTDQDVVKFLLFQQFYYGNDVVYGRTREISEQINGSGRVIERFLQILLDKLYLIKSKRYKEYLEKFSEEFHHFNIDYVYNSFLEEYNNLVDNEKNTKIVISILVGKLIQTLREQCFNEILHEIRIILIEKMARLKNRSQELKSSLEEVVEAKIDRLHQLFALNSKEISLIYNLVFLKFISFKLEEFRVYKNTLKLLNKYVDIVTKKLIDEINE